MLRKLLKYEYRANLRKLGLLWVGMILFAVVEHILIGEDIAEGSFLATLITLYGTALIATNIFVFILAIRRFYKGLLGREGYLMFTLPVSVTKLVLSKFIVALSAVLLNLIVTILCANLLNEGFSVSDWLLFSTWEDVCGILMVIAAISLGLMQIYLACCIGHLFRNHRVMWSVLTWFGLNFLMQNVTIGALRAILQSRDSLRLVVENPTRLLLGLTGMQAILALLFFLPCVMILKKRLNLK